MQNLTQIKNRIKVIKVTQKIIDAMRLIAISTYPRLTKNYAHIKKFLAQLKTVLQRLPREAKNVDDPAAHISSCYHNLVIIAASSKGLCGGFNSQLEHELTHKLEVDPEQRYEFITIGRNAATMLGRTNFLKLGNCAQINLPSLQVSNINWLMSQIKHQIEKNPMINQIIVASNQFKSIYLQRPNLTTIFPLSTASDAEKTSASAADTQEIIFEQDRAVIQQYLDNQYLYFSLYAALFESILCETAARFVITDAASQSAKKRIEQLSLIYHKTRQAAITREVAELSSSM